MASFKYNNCYIKDYFSIAGPMEKNGQIKEYDITLNDYYYNEKTFEDAEIKMQKIVLDNLLNKTKLTPEKIDLIVGGDLFNQIAITSTSLKNTNIPFLGLYSACATYIESLIIACNMLSHENINNVIAISSAHNLTAEKQFRYPVEYGSPKHKTNTFTATGSVSSLITKEKSNIKIESSTIGSVIDLGTKDVNNMGAVMTPAAAEVIVKHLKDLKRNINYYDLILTGDLGVVGTKILKEYLKNKYNIKLTNHLDAGTQIYNKNQDINAGASGPVALPLVLFNKILKSKKYKKILVIGTGSLHTTTLVNQKKSIPSIAHAISLEVK